MNAGAQGFLNMHNSLREPRGSTEPECCQLGNLTQDPNFRGNLVQGIRLCALNAGGLSLILDQGTRSHKPKLRPSTAKTKNKTEQLSKQLCIKIIP